MLSGKRKKIVKIAGAILLGLIILILIVFTGIQLYINKNKASFVKLVNEKLDDAIDGEASVKDVDINVWRHFPNIDVRITNLDIKDSVYKKSLVHIQYASTRINVLKLAVGKVDIHNLFLENGIIHLFTDKNGYSNTYIFKSDNPKKKPGSNPPVIDEIELKNIHFATENAVKNKWFGFKINQLNASLDYGDSVTTVSLRENALVKGLGFNLEKGYFLKDKPVIADWKLTFNRNQKHLSFDATAVKIGATDFVLNGDFFVKDTASAHFRLTVKTAAVGYREAASLVSPNIQKTIDIVSLTKPLALTAVIEGPMAFRTIPIVTVQWIVKNNQLITPVLTLDTCAFTGSFTNERNKAYPRTDDNSEIQLTKLAASWGGIKLVANTNTIVTNLVHPILQFDLSSTTTLAALDDKLGLATLHFNSGDAVLNLQYNGPLGTDPSRLQYLSGNLLIKNAEVNYAPRNLTFSKCFGEVIFSQSNLLVRNLQCDLNTNHFKVEVAGNNVNVLAGGNQPGKASLVCSVFTPDLDLSDFKTFFQSRNTPVVKTKSKGGVAKPLVQIDDALENGELDMNLTANAVHMDRFTAKNVQAQLAFTNNDINVAKVSLDHADGKLNLSANIHQVNGSYHQATTKLSLDHVDIQKLFFAFKNFGMQSLSSTNLHGTFYMNGNLQMNINNNGSLMPKSMLGNVHFSLKKGALVKFKPLVDIQKIVFKNRDLDHIEFAELKDSLEIKGDEVYVHRMEIESSAFSAFVQGIYSFGDNTDLSIQVPLSNLKKRDDDYKVKNRGTKRKAGASVYLRAKSDGNGGVKIGLDLFKKLRGGDDYAEQFRKDPGPK